MGFNSAFKGLNLTINLCHLSEIVENTLSLILATLYHRYRHMYLAPVFNFDSQHAIM